MLARMGQRPPNGIPEHSFLPASSRTHPMSSRDLFPGPRFGWDCAMGPGDKPRDDIYGVSSTTPDPRPPSFAAAEVWKQILLVLTTLPPPFIVGGRLEGRYPGHPDGILRSLTGAPSFDGVTFMASAISPCLHSPALHRGRH